MVFDAVETLRWAGGKPSLLEAEPFALQAALSEAGYLDDQGSVAALHVGFQSTDVTMFTRSFFESNRSLNVGGKSYIEGLIRELGITFERAAGLLAKERLTDEERASLDAVSSQVSDKIAEQVERSFPENFGPGAENPISKIVLCGGGAHLPMLAPALRHRFGIEVEVMNPFRNIEVDPKRVNSAAVESAPDYAAAVGLALRALGENHLGFNLLFPTDRPDHKKTTYAGLGTVLPIMGFSAILFGIAMTHLSQESKLTSLHDKLKGIQKETDLYRDKIALVEQLGNKRADVAARIDVISDLDRNRFARVKLMQLLNNALPDLTWITAVDEAGTSRGAGINITGMTSSNLKVSQFMTNLLQNPLVKGVDLQVSEQVEIADVNVTRFTLQVALPDLGINPVPVPQATNLIKQGAKAAKDQKAAQAKSQKEASK
jgi:Tfp pilus assembly protein PilN